MGSVPGPKISFATAVQCVYEVTDYTKQTAILTRKRGQLAITAARVCHYLHWLSALQQTRRDHASCSCIHARDLRGYNYYEEEYFWEQLFENRQFTDSRWQYHSYCCLLWTFGDIRNPSTDQITAYTSKNKRNYHTPLFYHYLATSHLRTEERV